MKFIIPSAEELAGLRADPLLWEQETRRPPRSRGIDRARDRKACGKSLLAIRE